MECDIKIQNANNMGIEHRKMMLKSVMLKLYHDLKTIKKDKKGYKEKEVIQEMRLRCYKIISNLVWEKFEHKKCESETQVKIQDIIDFCKDNPKKKLHCFEVYTKLYTATITEKILIKFSAIPLLGRFFYRKLVELIYAKYDLLLTLSDTIGEVLESEQFLKEEFKNWKDIKNELRIQLNSFERARERILSGNKKLVTSIQTKKAGRSILNFGFYLLIKLHNSGEIDDLEFNKLKSQLDTIYYRLNHVQFYINKCSGKKDLKKTDINAEDYESIDKDEDSKFNFKEMGFRRKISIIFPFLKELKRPELEELHAQVIPENAKNEDPEICLPHSINLNTLENVDYVYLVKEGMFEILSESGRTVEYMSNSDVFGLTPLIAKDVKMRAKPMADTKYYKVKSDVLLKFMDKYPFLQKTLYSYAIEIYLKCSLSKLARTKTSYFRRLRRLSSTYLTDIFEEGSIRRFEDPKMILNYFYEEHLSSVGFFALKGRFKVVHHNPHISKIKQFFKLNKVDDILDHIVANSSIKKLGNYTSTDPRDKLTEDFYSIRRRNDTGYVDSDDHLHKVVEIEPGNAVLIHPDFLEKIEFLDDVIVVFILEAQVGLTSNKNPNLIGSVKKLSNILRKRKTVL